MSKDPDKRSPGRPPGKDYPVAIHTRLTELQRDKLDAWAAGAQIGRAEAIRRLIAKGIDKPLE